MMTSHYENAVPEFLDTAVAELSKLRQQITSDYFASVADLINASETYGGRVHLTGIGKSECALDLITRGHYLIADDSVLIKKVGDKLEGKSPELIQDYLEEELRAFRLLYKATNRVRVGLRFTTVYAKRRRW